jgi:hypothetical protein
MFHTGLEHIITDYVRRWVLRGRKQKIERSIGDAGWLLKITGRERFSVLIFLGIMSTIFYGAYFVEGNIFVNEPAWKRIALELVSIALWLLSIYAALKTFIERITVNENGITRISIHGRKTLHWERLASIELATNNQALMLVSIDGSRLPVSIYFDGLQSLITVLGCHITVPHHIKITLENIEQIT